MQLGVSVIGLRPLIERCAEAGADAQPLTNAAVAKSATQIQRNVRIEAPHRTGNLQRSILTTTSDSVAIVSAEERYAIYVEKGTAPHVILPKNKKALFWTGASNPYAAVNHPGTKANPFFSRGVDMSLEYVQQTFQAVADQIIAQLAGA